MRTNLIVTEIESQFGGIANYAKQLDVSKQYIYKVLHEMEENTASVKAQNKLLNPLGYEVIEIKKQKLRKVK